MGNINALKKTCSVEGVERMTDSLKTLITGEANIKSLKYEIEYDAHLGTGKFGEVYQCHEKVGTSFEKYAMKIISTDSNDAVSIKRIYDEIQILQNIHHPSVISLIDFDDISDPYKIFVIFEFCSGGELYEVIKHCGRYFEADGVILLNNLFEGIAYLHSHGIIHRDLKPENILLKSSGNKTDIVISDFGLSKICNEYPRRSPRSTSICGSDFYLAPEVIRQEEYGTEIDIWAAGVISFVVLTARLPFYHEVLYKLYRQILECDLDMDQVAWLNLSEGARNFILRLFTINPRHRISAKEALRHPWLRGCHMDFTKGGNTPHTNPYHSLSRRYY